MSVDIAVDLAPQVLVAGGMLVVLFSCANPQPPGGGPRDETPPTIRRTNPVQDTTNVPTDTRSVYVEFSEYVQRSTVPQALSITPEFDGRIRFDWSGQGVNIELPTSLRDSTTYLFTFDKNLSDAHGVSLNEPVRVAFATGPRINKGELRGRVVEPTNGDPRGQMDVFAYGLAGQDTTFTDSLPERPAYRTQTGDDGRFTFRYMREQQYYVVAVRDNNRNRRPDPGEAYAVPPRFAIQVDRGSAAVPVPWLLTKADTVRPKFQRAQVRSQRRIRLIFSEPIQLDSRRPTDWSLRDSVGEGPVDVRSVYRPAGRSDALVLRTATMDTTRHLLPLTSRLVSDTLDQSLVPDTARFQGVSRSDTTQTRFRAFVPEDLSPDSAGTFPLLPGQQPGIRFNQSVDSSTLRRVVTVQDTAGESMAYTLTTRNGRTYRIQSDPPLSAGAVLEVLVDGGTIAGLDTTRGRRFRRVTDRVLGGLEGTSSFSTVSRSDSAGREFEEGPPTMEDSVGGGETTNARRTFAGPEVRPDSQGEGPIVVELIPTETSLPVDTKQQTVVPESTFVFRGLPQGTFRFRAYGDRNENGRWDGGLIHPYEPPEPMTWTDESTDSRPRWTNVISAPLEIPIFVPGPRSEPSRSDTTGVDSLN